MFTPIFKNQFSVDERQKIRDTSQISKIHSNDNHKIANIEPFIKDDLNIITQLHNKTKTDIFDPFNI